MEQVSICILILFTLSLNPDFKQPWESNLLKTLWERNKMLVTSILNSFHNISMQFLSQGCYKSVLWGKSFNSLSIYII